MSMNYNYLLLLLFFRELAIQIAEQFEALGSGIGIKCAVVGFQLIKYTENQKS